MVNNQADLRIAILQELLNSRKIRPKTGGLNRAMLCQNLAIESDEEMELAINFLTENKLIENEEFRLLLINEKGIDFLFKNAPSCDPDFAKLCSSILSVLQVEGKGMYFPRFVEQINAPLEVMELACWYLRGKDLIGLEEDSFKITEAGLICIIGWTEPDKLSSLVR